MSEYRTPEEDTIGGRRDPEEAREDAGLEPEGGGEPEGEPPKRREQAATQE